MTDTLSIWDLLGHDLTELILSKLPIPSIIRASSVCKLWNSIIHSYVSNSRKLFPSWFFICGQNKNHYNNSQVFAFDPESNYWIKLPADATLRSKDGFFFFTTFSGKFSFKPVFDRTWRQTSPSLRFSTCNPLIGAYNEPGCCCLKSARFIAVAGGLENINTAGGCLAVEIYNPDNDSWEICSHLPEIFRPTNTNMLCSSLYGGKFYVYSIYSGFVSFFHLEKRIWSNVQTLRPPGMMLSYLISCDNRLVLAGLCGVRDDEIEFNIWEIDEKTLEFREIGIMPPDLLSMFLDIDGEGDQRLKCVGSGNVVYVFNGKLCVCEISSSGKCSWKMVPDLPGTVNEFDKVNVSAFVPKFR